MDIKEYKFLVSMCNGWCNGILTISAEDEDKAYEKAIDYVGEKLTAAFPELDIPYNVELYEEKERETELCICCGKEIVLDDNEYERIDGELYCSECVEEHFEKCEWCHEYVPHEELAYYGNILCCNDCATNDWERMERVLGGR